MFPHRPADDLAVPRSTAGMYTAGGMYALPLSP